MQGCDHVFSLAADMGGMGFIQSNHSVILYNNTMIRWVGADVCDEQQPWVLTAWDGCVTASGQASKGAGPGTASLNSHPCARPCCCSFNMMEAARQAGVTRFFYASSACIYPEHRQLDTEVS